MLLSEHKVLILKIYLLFGSHEYFVQGSLNVIIFQTGASQKKTLNDSKKTCSIEFSL